MEEQLQNIEGELRLIKERNVRVEAEKAWETSFFRVGSITLIIYAVASFVLFAIGNASPFRNALIPAVGYFLSTQSLPFIKKNWIQTYLARRKK